MASTTNRKDHFQIAYRKIKTEAPTCGAMLLGYLAMKASTGVMSVEEAISEAQMEEIWPVS